jgi:hypothetical protein
MIPHDSRARGVGVLPSRLGFLALTFVLSACTGNPNLPSEGGNWSGTLNDQVSGAGTITLSLSQTDGTLTGTYAMTGLPVAADDETGSVSGGLGSDTTASLTLTPTDPNRCVLFGNATISGNQMTVTYDSPTCTLVPRVREGTFVVDKQ